MILLLACSGTTIDNDVVEGLPGIDELAGVQAAIDEGRVPRLGEDYVVPAVFWSQDTPLDGDCLGDLCARLSTALFNSTEGEDGVLVVLDFEPEPSAVDENLVIAIDTSGSMGADRMDALRLGLDQRVSELDLDDLGALVTFTDSARTRRSPRSMGAL